MEDGAGEPVPTFLPVELREHAPAVGLVADGLGERRRPSAALQDPHHLVRAGLARFERACYAEQVVPIFRDQFYSHALPRRALERSVVDLAVHAPEPRLAEIGQPRAKLVAEQPEESEDRIAVARGVGHDFGRLKAGLLFEKSRKHVERVAQRAGHHDGVEARK